MIIVPVDLIVKRILPVDALIKDFQPVVEGQGPVEAQRQPIGIQAVLDRNVLSGHNQLRGPQPF